MDLPPPAGAKAKTADVDKMLASAARRMLGADATRTTYVSHDHLGSPSLETNERGAVVARRWHGPYGEVRGASGAWAEARGFTGKERDETTGLADHGARYLDTRLGRWTAPDPLAVRELGGAELDVYGYVEGRVTSEHDPDGQAGHIVFGAAVGGFVGLAVEGARQAYTRQFDGRALAVAAIGGMASGAMGAATGGASLASQATVGGVTSAYVGTLSRAVQGQQVTSGTLATDTAIGAVAPAVAKIAAPVVTNAMARVFGRAIVNVRSAAQVNREMVAAGNLPAWGGKVVTTEVVPAGTRYNMVVSQVQAEALKRGKPWFGGWATADAIPDQAFARQKLAILPEFKGDVSMVVQVETTAPQTVNRGVVGRLETESGAFSGGASQVEFILGKNLRLVGDPAPLPAGDK